MTTRRNERGAIAMMVALAAVFLFVLAALVVDLGLARDTRHQAQTAADAAALAAANVVYPGGTCKSPVGATPPCINDAVDAAKSYASANFPNGTDWTECPSAPSGYVVPVDAPSCVSFDSLTTPRHIWVLLPGEKVDMTLGAAAGVDDVTVSARARAVLDGSGVSECGLCLLGFPNDPDHEHYIQNGSIALNGTSLQANNNLGTQQNNGHITVTGGTVKVEGDAEGNISPQATEDAGHLEDPLAGVELPSPTNGYFSSPVTPKTNICTQGAGIYNAPNISTNNCVLTAGLYVITGDLRFTGQRSINATAGVTLFFTCRTNTTPRNCAAGEAGGSMTFAGQGTISIKAPAPPSKTAGLSIVSDRNNTAAIEFRGNGAGSVSGTIYAASGTLGFRGNGNGSMDSLVVVKTLDFRGNPSTMSLVYTAGNNVVVPPKDPALDK